MLFRRQFHAALRSGAIDRSYRRWKSPKVKIGGRYRFTPEDAVEVTSLDEVTFDDLDDDAARAAGFDTLPELKRELERAGRRPLTKGESLFRVGLRPVSVSIATAPSTATRSQAITAWERIEAIEKRSRGGPWAWATLELISSQPRRRAGDLAAKLGADLRPFKARVRRLKELGLTESFEVGYGLTALGEAALREHRRARSRA